MPAHAMSFPEVLEEEYRYFFEDEPCSVVEFERRHVREINDLADYLQALIHGRGATPSRWHLLATRCFGEGGTSTRIDSREEAVLAAFNEMLRDPALLTHLATDDQFLVELAASPELQHSLLRIPKARRLLLERPELSVQMGDDSLIDEFASLSAAIRLLLAHPAPREGADPVDGRRTHPGPSADRTRPPAFRAALQLYPAMLSTIADDKPLSRAIEADPAIRSNIVRAFAVPRTDRGVLWLAARVPARVAHWHRRTFIRRSEDLVAMSLDPEKLQEMVDPAAATKSEGTTIPPEHLSRFNAILIEMAYGHYVANGQSVRVLYRAIRQKETAALCLSGGGIRSATFNLGVLQGLADHRMLNRIHYLSTVSGGGYIGSWLSSWMRRHREGAVGVAKDLSREPVNPLLPEVKPIVYLREYSSYLAPRSSAFSLDGWTLVATYIRNLLLNWTMLLPFLVAVLALPRLLELYSRDATVAASERLADGAVALAFLVSLVVGALRPNCKPSADTPRRRSLSMWWWFVPLIGSAVAFCVYWPAPTNRFLAGRSSLPLLFAVGAALGAAVHALRAAAIRRLWIDVMAATGSTAKSPFRKALAFFASVQHLGFLRLMVREIFWTFAAGAAGGWLLQYLFVHAFPPRSLAMGVNLERYVLLGVPLFLSVFFAEAALLVGFMTRFSEDHEREWWARGGAALLVYCMVHVILVFSVLILPALILQAPKLAAPFGGLAGIGSYLLSKRLEVKKSGAEEQRNRWLMPLLRIAAGVTLMLVIAGVSVLTSSFLTILKARKYGFFELEDTSFAVPWRILGDYVTDATVEHFHRLRETPLPALYALIVVAAAVAMFMSGRLNVNVYSMHGMYRNRLIRAYLAASRWMRYPDRFTGFDHRDNMRMCELRPEMLWPSCIIDFDAFARQLTAEPFWSMIAVDTQNHVFAYLTAEKPEEQRALRETARTMIVEAVNHLLLRADLEHLLEVQPSPELLVRNRRYLDSRFPLLLRRFERDVALPSAGKERPVPADTPFPDREAKPVRGRPPLHIVNAALNLVNGKNLAWQERKAASFTISALHSGSRLLGYRDSATYGHGITLGTALAISGAAVSPNSGASSSPTFTFLMTLLNARLGSWLGNPRRPSYLKNAPSGSIKALLCEALGHTDSEQDFVFLSDGGHFENLGLYEMVLRRCKYIIVCDATADDRYAFGDLANAVRMIRIDLGVPIEPLETKYIGPQANEIYGKYCAFGDIRYSNVDGGDSIGHLLYIKPAVYSDCPPDVRNYRNESRSFPHENTADQFFSESQFESYRALGRHVIGAIAGDKLGDDGANVVPNIASFFAAAYAYVNGKQPPMGDAPVGTMKDVVSWMATSLGDAEPQKPKRGPRRYQ
jgi:hypothetical protein